MWAFLKNGCCHLAFARSPPKKVPVLQLAVDGGGCVGVGGAVSNRGFITGPTGMNYRGRGGEFAHGGLSKDAPSAQCSLASGPIAIHRMVAGECRQSSPFGQTLSEYTRPGNNACTWLRECCRPVKREELTLPNHV